MSCHALESKVLVWFKKKKNTDIPLLSTQAEMACYPNFTKMKRTSNNFFPSRFIFDVL